MQCYMTILNSIYKYIDTFYATYVLYLLSILFCHKYSYPNIIFTLLSAIKLIISYKRSS